MDDLQEYAESVLGYGEDLYARASSELARRISYVRAERNTWRREERRVRRENRDPITRRSRRWPCDERRAAARAIGNPRVVAYRLMREAGLRGREAEPSRRRALISLANGAAPEDAARAEIDRARRGLADGRSTEISVRLHEHAVRAGRSFARERGRYSYYRYVRGLSVEDAFTALVQEKA